MSVQFTKLKISLEMTVYNKIGDIHMYLHYEYYKTLVTTNHNCYKCDWPPIQSILWHFATCTIYKITFNAKFKQDFVPREQKGRFQIWRLVPYVHFSTSKFVGALIPTRALVEL